LANGYLQSLVLISGNNVLVEQRSLAYTGELSFWLAQWGSYTFRIVSDQGQYSELFVAQDPSQVYKIILTAGNFGSSPNLETQSIGAHRNNATEIHYWGSTNGTISAYSVSIFHYDQYSSSHEEIVDYTDSGSGAFSGEINGFDSATAYFADINVTISGLIYEHKISIPASWSSEAFSGLSEGFASFGDLGITPLAFLAFIICVIVGACFSYANFELGAAAVVVCAVILGFLGFYAFSGANLALGGFIVFLAYAHKAKMTERDM
jgi:hypothetical protein